MPKGRIGLSLSEDVLEILNRLGRRDDSPNDKRPTRTQLIEDAVRAQYRTSGQPNARANGGAAEGNIKSEPSPRRLDDCPHCRKPLDVSNEAWVDAGGFAVHQRCAEDAIAAVLGDGPNAGQLDPGVEQGRARGIGGPGMPDSDQADGPGYDSASYRKSMESEPDAEQAVKDARKVKRSGVKPLRGAQAWPCPGCDGRHTEQIFQSPGVHLCMACGNEVLKPEARGKRKSELGESVKGALPAKSYENIVIAPCLHLNKDLRGKRNQAGAYCTACGVKPWD